MELHSTRSFFELDDFSALCPTLCPTFVFAWINRLSGPPYIIRRRPQGIITRMGIAAGGRRLFVVEKGRNRFFVDPRITEPRSEGVPQIVNSNLWQSGFF